MIVLKYLNYKCIELNKNYIKQVELVVLNDEIYGNNSLWKIPLNEFNKGEIGKYITNLSNEELKQFNGYIKENHSTSLIYNNLFEYLEKEQISFQDLIQEEIEETIGG